MIIDQQLKYNYERATYEILKTQIQLRLGKSSQQLIEFLIDNQTMEWSIITAFNPGSKLLDNQVNKQRHLELLNRLTEENRRWVLSKNADPAGQWPDEIGCFILDISKADALVLAKAMGQKGLVYGSLEGVAQLLWTGL